MTDKNTVLKTALYCRTAQQSNLGIEKQKEWLSRFAEENDYHNLSWYIDDGESGTTLKRPATERLIMDIQAGEVQTVIVTSASRIARNTALMYDWFRILRDAGVPCLSLDCGGQEIGGGFNFYNDFMDMYLTLYQRFVSP